MNGVEMRGLRRAVLCLALLTGGTAYGQSNVPAPRDVPSSAPAVPSPSQVLAPSQQASPPEKNASAPGASSAAAVPPTPPDQPAQKAEAKPKKKAAAPAPETALSEDPTPVFQPETPAATARAIEQYARIVEAGGWPTVSKPLNPGAKGKGVAEAVNPTAEDAYWREFRHALVMDNR